MFVWHRNFYKVHSFGLSFFCIEQLTAIIIFCFQHIDLVERLKSDFYIHAKNKH